MLPEEHLTKVGRRQLQQGSVQATAERTLEAEVWRRLLYGNRTERNIFLGLLYNSVNILTGYKSYLSWFWKEIKAILLESHG